MEDFIIISENPPNLGDLGYIPWDGQIIPVAVVNHMLEKETLCFMSRLSENSSSIRWETVDSGFTTRWKRAGSFCNVNEAFNWIYSIQPERSKREDSLLREFLESCPAKLDISQDAEPPLVWDKDLNFIGHKVLEEMRCSEHCGNTMREVR